MVDAQQYLLLIDQIHNRVPSDLWTLLQHHQRVVSRGEDPHQRAESECDQPVPGWDGQGSKEHHHNSVWRAVLSVWQVSNTRFWLVDINNAHFLLVDRLLPKHCAPLIAQVVNKKKREKAPKKFEFEKPGFESYRKTREDLTTMDKVIFFVKLLFLIPINQAPHGTDRALLRYQLLHHHQCVGVHLRTQRISAPTPGDQVQSRPGR